MRHSLAMIALATMLWLAAGIAPAQTTPPAAPQTAVDVHVFWRIGCPHCERARTFLHAAAARDAGLRLREYEIGGHRANRDAFTRAVEHFGIQNPAVPTIIVGERHFVGYDDDATTGAAILDAVAACRAQPCADMAPAFFGDAPPARAAGSRADGAPKTIRLPLLGELELATVSLPVLTVLLAAIDGFNPCAMWTLLFLMGLLVGIPDRIRMWTLGAAFIAASAAVYYLFLAAWLNLLLFLGMVAWIRAAVALVALAGGAYYLREFFVNPEAMCRVTGGASRQQVLARLRAFALERRFWLALTGIVLLAVAVNLVEFICSAGIPAVYVQVLALSDLPPWQYHAYLLLYILVFMLDDLLVFVVAMKTLQVTGLTGAYARWSHLIGGSLLLLIGLLLLFRPEWLVFG
jgi:glutaredoxin